VAVAWCNDPHCLAMKRALEEILEPDVLLPQHPGASRRYVVGAYGVGRETSDEQEHRQAPRHRPSLTAVRSRPAAGG